MATVRQIDFYFLLALIVLHTGNTELAPCIFWQTQLKKKNPFNLEQ